MIRKFTLSLYITAFCICIVGRVVSQTTNSNKKLNELIETDGAEKKPVAKSTDASKSATPADTAGETGISVSPSTLRFNCKPGGSQTKTIKVTNDTKSAKNFQINFQNYAAGSDAKESIATDGISRTSLSKYIVVSPTLVELKPREAKIISVTIELPAGDSSAIAMWTTLIIDQITERPKLETPGSGNNNALSLGITAGIGFGVNIHQNPPNVAINNVEIKSVKYEKATEKTPHAISMKAKNMGDGIGYCLYYIELTNLLTGKQTKLKVKQFGILPGFEKEFKFDLPKELEKGKYSALAVLDFGNKEELQTAELDFSIQ